MIAKPITPSELEEAIREELLDEIADLEEYAKRGERPPHSCRGYRVRIDGERHVFQTPTVTGREVLQQAGLTPVHSYTLRLKVRGEKPCKIAPDDIVDLTTPGVERFKAIPRDQTNG